MGDDDDVSDDDGASISLQGPDGQASGSSRWVMPTRLVFEGQREFGAGWSVEYGSNYEATVAWSGGSHTWEFQTSADAAADDYAPVEDQVFLIEPAAGTIIAPGVSGQFVDNPGVGSWFDTFPQTVPWAVDVDGLGTFEFLLRDLVISGWLNDTVGVSETIDEGQVSFNVDARDLNLGSCATAAPAFGGECMPCPHAPGVDECIVVQAYDIWSVRVTDTSVIDRTPQDIANDIGCSGN